MNEQLEGVRVVRQTTENGERPTLFLLLLISPERLNEVTSKLKCESLLKHSLKCCSGEETASQPSLGRLVVISLNTQKKGFKIANILRGEHQTGSDFSRESNDDGREEFPSEQTKCRK